MLLTWMRCAYHVIQETEILNFDNPEVGEEEVEED